MKTYKKIVSALLTLLMPVQAASGLDLNSTKVGNKSFDSIKFERKNLGGKIFVGGCLTCIGASAAVIGSLTIAEIYKSRTKEISNFVENLEDKDIADKILEETEKLQKRSNGIFEVEKSFCEVDPRVTLRFLLQINMTLDTFKGFEKLLIENHRNRAFFLPNHKFVFATGQFASARTMACFCGLDADTEIIISRDLFKDLSLAELEIAVSILSGHNVKVKFGKELESVIVHELGHALQYALHLKESCKTLEEITKEHKLEILKIAFSKYGAKNDFVSRYGETDEQEWFAELFAHALLSDTPTSLGLAMLDFLKIHGMY